MTQGNTAQNNEAATAKIFTLKVNEMSVELVYLNERVLQEITEAIQSEQDPEQTLTACVNGAIVHLFIIVHLPRLEVASMCSRLVGEAAPQS